MYEIQIEPGVHETFLELQERDALEQRAATERALLLASPALKAAEALRAARSQRTAAVKQANELFAHVRRLLVLAAGRAPSDTPEAGLARSMLGFLDGFAPEKSSKDPS